MLASDAHPEADSRVPVDAAAAAIPAGRATHWTLENLMFAFLLERFGRWFERAEQRRLHDFLAESSDLGELERRMRSLERNGYPN